MTGKGHFATGIVFSAFVFDSFNNLNLNGFVGATFCILGVNAPDYLEIRTKVYSGNALNGKRRCIGTKTKIRHRTITHWLPIWILLFAVSLISLNLLEFNNTDLNAKINYLNLGFDHTISQLFFTGLLGYSIGGLLHLLTDLPNPMGIPIITPYKRFSLNLWKSGKMEPFIIFCFIVFVGYSLNIIEINIDSIKNILI